MGKVKAQSAHNQEERRRIENRQRGIQRGRQRYIVDIPRGIFIQIEIR
jgi:hypothetical protein